MTKTLNSCINWDAESNALDVVKNWKAEQLAEVEKRILEKENHIRQLMAEKKELAMQQAPSTALNTFDSERQAKETELNEIANHPMRKHFWKKKIEELQNEIEDIDSKKKLTAHRKEETAAMIRDIDRNIKMEEKSIETYKRLVSEAVGILEDLKTETRMRTGVPFSAIDFTGIIELMDEYVDDGRVPFAITIQVGSSTLKLLADMDGTHPVFGATLNNDTLFTDDDDNETINADIKSLQILFKDNLSKVYDLDEQPAQAMNGQVFDKDQMEEIYAIAGNITKHMENLNAEMNHYYRTMNLPISFSEDGHYHGNESLNTLEERVGRMIDVMENDAVEKYEPLESPVSQNTAPYPVESPQSVEPAPVQIPTAPTAPVQDLSKKAGPAPVQSMPAPTVPTKPKPKKARKQAPKAQTAPQSYAEGEAANGMLYSSRQAESHQDQRLPKGLADDMKREASAAVLDNQDMSFTDFDHKYRSERLENLNQSKKTEVEANAGKVHI